MLIFIGRMDFRCVCFHRGLDCAEILFRRMSAVEIIASDMLTHSIRDAQIVWTARRWFHDSASATIFARRVKSLRSLQRCNKLRLHLVDAALHGDLLEVREGETGNFQKPMIRHAVSQ
jgi:hypothetical protein